MRHSNVETTQSIGVLLKAVFDRNEWRVFGAERAHKKGNHAKARRLLERVLAEVPTSLSANTSLAWLLCDEGDVEAATEHLRIATRAKPEHTEAWIRLGEHLATHTGETAEAEQCLRTAIELSPRFALGRRVYGDLLERRGEIERARASYAEAARLEPRSQTNIAACARFYARVGDLPLADSLFAEAVALFKCDHPIRLDYARFCWTSLGELDRADLLYREAVRFGSRDYTTYGQYAVFLHQARRDFAHAAYNYRQGLRFRPGNSWLSCNLGGLLCECGDAAEGLRLVRAALETATDPAQRLEAMFFVFAHGEASERPHARGEIERLLDDGARSPEWRMDDHVRIAEDDPAHLPGEARRLAERIATRP